MGDSIVEGVVPGGWRAPLYALLTNEHFNVQMVGDQTSNSGGGLPGNEGNHEAIGGVTSEQIEAYLDQNNILATYTPDVITLSCGGNDMYGVQGDSPQQAYASMVSLCTDIITKLPGVKLIVGTLPPVQQDAAIDNSTELGQFNLLLPGLAGISPRISVVNVTPVINLATDIGADGIHPNVAGNARIAAVFNAGIVADFPPAGVTPAPTPTPVPAATASANNTMVLSGSTDAITDASGNKWTITSTGQVAMNGLADATTANVAELAYANKAVWQQNSDNLWWGKTTPTAAWAPGTNPLPAAIAIASGTTSTTVSQSQISVLATAGNHMLFLSGSGDVVSLTGGTNTITDTGNNNTYLLPAAGKGTDIFTSNILIKADTLDLKPALAATDWNGAASTLAKYLTVTDSAQGATLSVAATSGGPGVAIASINGATTATLTSLLAHAIT
jgi:lysophospholipase L1-like esterase